MTNSNSNILVNRQKIVNSTKVSLLLKLIGLFVITVVCLILFGGGKIDYASLKSLKYYDISLSPWMLPYYLGMSLLRIIIASIISLVLGVYLGRIMSTNANKWILILVDVLQSIPATGFMSLVSLSFIRLIPKSLIGAQIAVIFTVICSQIWNIILDTYRHFISMPLGYQKLAKNLNLSESTVFWNITFPSLVPLLIWNITVSMSASWFMIVASESIVYAINNQIFDFHIPGIGGYVYKANTLGDYRAIGYAALGLLLVVITVDRLIIKPLLKTPSFKLINQFNRLNLLYFYQKTKTLINKINKPFKTLWSWGFLIMIVLISMSGFKFTVVNQIFLSIFNGISGFYLSVKTLNYYDILWRSLFSTSRIVITLIINLIMSLIVLLPLSKNTSLALKTHDLFNLLASFPADLIYGVLMIYAKRYWVSKEVIGIILLVVSSWWYLIFNLISGIKNNSNLSWLSLKEISYKIGFFNTYRKVIIPMLLPNLIVGLILSSGASWNAIVISEMLTWQENNFYLYGIGSFLMKHNHDPVATFVGIFFMGSIIAAANNYIWQPLLKLTINKFNIIYS